MYSLFRIFIASFILFVFTPTFNLAQASPMTELDALNMGKFNAHDASPSQFEAIDIRTGALSIEHVDLEIPGNGGLDIIVSRSFNKSYEGIDIAMMGNWELEVPRVVSGYGTPYPLAQGLIQGGTGWCEAPKPAQGDFWTGLQLILPKQKPKRLYFKSKNAEQYPKTIQYVTEDHWLVSCIPNKLPNGQYGRNHGFKVYAPNGTQYYIDFLASFYGDTGNAWKPSWLKAFVSQIVDKNGNSLVYNYQLGHLVTLTSIKASDGRVVELEYGRTKKSKLPVLTQIKANGQTWQYHYTKYAILYAATLPDGAKWQYNYGGAYIPGYGSWLLEHIQNITTPNGLSISYGFGGIKAKYFGGTKSKYTGLTQNYSELIKEL